MCLSRERLFPAGCQLREDFPARLCSTHEHPGQELTGDGLLKCELASPSIALLHRHKLFKKPAALSLPERVWPSKWIKEIAVFLSAWGDFVSECFCARPLLCDCLLLLSSIILIIKKKKPKLSRKKVIEGHNTISVLMALSDEIP